MGMFKPQLEVRLASVLQNRQQPWMRGLRQLCFWDITTGLPNPPFRSAGRRLLKNLSAMVGNAVEGELQEDRKSQPKAREGRSQAGWTPASQTQSWENDFLESWTEIHSSQVLLLTILLFILCKSIDPAYLLLWPGPEGRSGDWVRWDRDESNQPYPPGPVL